MYYINRSTALCISCPAESIFSKIATGSNLWFKRVRDASYVTIPKRSLAILIVSTLCTAHGIKGDHTGRCAALKKNIRSYFKVATPVLPRGMIVPFASNVFNFFQALLSAAHGSVRCDPLYTASHSVFRQHGIFTLHSSEL